MRLGCQKCTDSLNWGFLTVLTVFDTIFVCEVIISQFYMIENHFFYTFESCQVCVRGSKIFEDLQSDKDEISENDE